MSQHFYIKIAYQNKIKKFALSSIKQIKFDQIKKGFSLTQKWKDSIFSYKPVSDFNLSQNDNPKEFNQSQLVKYLLSLQIKPKQTIKFRIIQKQTMSQQENRRKQSYDSFEIPNQIQKKRSKSMQIKENFDQTCNTQIFDVTSNFVLGQLNKINEFQQLNELIDENEKGCNKIEVRNQRKQKQNYIMTKKLQQKSQQIEINPNFSTESMNQNYRNDFQRCLHQSIRITQKQKNEIQKLQQKISTRQKQLGLDKQKSKISKIFKLLNI